MAQGRRWRKPVFMQSSLPQMCAVFGNSREDSSERGRRDAQPEGGPSKVREPGGCTFWLMVIQDAAHFAVDMRLCSDEMVPWFGEMGGYDILPCGLVASESVDSRIYALFISEQFISQDCCAFYEALLRASKVLTASGSERAQHPCMLGGVSDPLTPLAWVARRRA